jgi:hypothetical protein
MFIPFPIYRTAAAACMVAMASASWAADPLTLIEAQRLAVGRSQQLVAQGALTAAAREQAVAAGQLPDPVLKFGIDNLPADAADRGSLTRDFMTMRRIGVMQEITRSEKRRLRTERFERDAQRVQAQRQLTLANLQRDTALAWLDRYYTQAMRELVQQQAEETRLQVQAADVAFRNGRGSQADVFAARSAVIQLEDRLSQIDRQLRNAGLMLARWVGTPDAERPLSGSPPWQTTPLQGEISSEHLQQHPDLLAMSAEVDAVDTDARLAQANKQADWSVEASYAQRGPAYANMISIGVSIPLQWDQKNRQNRELRPDGPGPASPRQAGQVAVHGHAAGAGVRRCGRRQHGQGEASQPGYAGKTWGPPYGRGQKGRLAVRQWRSAMSRSTSATSPGPGAQQRLRRAPVCARPLDPVKKGQPLAELYVPDWVAAQEEYLSVKRMQGGIGTWDAGSTGRASACAWPG